MKSVIEHKRNSDPCPSGMKHNIVEKVVKNVLGHLFCCHTDCIHANMSEIESRGLAPKR